MMLRSQRSYPETEISIMFVNSKNKRKKITLTSNSSIRDLYQAAYNGRASEYADASLENYQQAINLYCQGIKLKNVNSILGASNITTNSVIRETFKKWTNAINVDQETLAITDPITLEPIIGKPYLLPDCNHALGKESLTRWIEERLRDSEEPNCPCCRATISDEHIDKLVPVRPQPLRRLFMISFGANPFALFPPAPEQNPEQNEAELFPQELPDLPPSLLAMLLLRMLSELRDHDNDAVSADEVSTVDMNPDEVSLDEESVERPGTPRPGFH